MSYKIHMKGRDDQRTLFQIDRLHAWKYGQYFSPATVEISPTNVCNQKCIYCYAWRDLIPKNFLRDNIFVTCFDQLADVGVGAVVIQGTGEPLLHKALPEAVKRGFEHNIPIQITTNGVLLNKSLQDRILPHLFCLRISVINSDPTGYAKQHGCDAQHWHKLVANIENTMSFRARANLSFSTMATVYLSGNNFNQLYNSVKFCKDIGFDFVYVTEPTFTSHSPLFNNPALSTSPERIEFEINSARAKILALIDDDFFVKIKLNTQTCPSKKCTAANWEYNRCQGIKFYTLIDCDGEIYPCWRCWGEKKFSHGSLYENSFSEIWQSEQRKQVENVILNTPPENDECSVCTIDLLNNILHQTANATQWKDFL